MISSKTLIGSLTLTAATCALAFVAGSEADAVAPASPSFAVAMDGSSFFFEGPVTESDGILVRTKILTPKPTWR